MSRHLSFVHILFMTDGYDAVMDDLLCFRERFDPLFRDYLAAKCAALPADMPSGTAVREALLEYAAGGKRLRPYIAYVASGVLLETLADSSLLSLLYALELYHLFALIHDDLIDHSETRRGTPCMHIRFGNTMALLLGDLCLSWAHESIAAVRDDPYVSATFSALSEETIIGQLLDTTQAKMPITEASLNRTIELKTARYTVIYPLFLGRAWAGTRHAAEASSLVRFGRAVGHAFQRLDDLCDVYDDADQLGKAPCGDVRTGTPTHLWLFLDTYGTQAQRTTGSMLWGNPEASPNAIRSLLTEVGAEAYERTMIDTLLSQARAALAGVTDAARWEPCITMLAEKLHRR